MDTAGSVTVFASVIVVIFLSSLLFAWAVAGICGLLDNGENTNG